MAKKGGGETKQDLSGFMPILLLSIGCLVFLLIVNTIIIMANPSNVRITSIVRSALFVEGGLGTEGGQPFPNGNKEKEPVYIDVHKDHLTLFPGEDVVSLVDLEVEGNAFEQFLQDVATKHDELYIVLLVRPRAAMVARRLKKAIYAQNIDIGYELFEEERAVNYDSFRRKLTSM